MTTTSQKYVQAVDASPSQVYRSFTNATALREWLCDTATINPRPGGHFFLAWSSGYYACGEFIKLLADKEIQLIWEGRDDPAATKVRVLISSLDNGMTTFSLEHLDLNENAEWAAAFKDISNGWSKGILNLVSVLENGPDLRIVNRPMLGVTFGDFDQHRAASLGVPLSEGLRVENVVDGMGAQSAGLQRNDVIFSLNGKSTPDYAAVVSALETHQAGDQVELGLYRGSEKKKIKIELSRRPIPEVPATAAGLAEAVRKNSTEGIQRLSHLLRALKEAEADFHSKPDEWSVKEILAHLIHGERDNQSFIQDLVFSQERMADGFSDNLAARVRATVSAYPTIANLLSELQASQAETISLVQNLPDELVAMKGSFWRIGYRLLENTYHFQEHEAQIAAVLGVARR
jgi:uncharacterized protein YndB with AHSA1/START domain